MVRARAVAHPSEWIQSGYQEIQNPPFRYGLIDRKALIELCCMQGDEQFKVRHREWVEQALQDDLLNRLPAWSEAVAIGSEGFVEQMKQDLGALVQGRKTMHEGEAYLLREPEASYSVHFGPEKDALRSDNAVFFDENIYKSTG